MSSSETGYRETQTMQVHSVDDQPVTGSSVMAADGHTERAIFASSAEALGSRYQAPYFAYAGPLETGLADAFAQDPRHARHQANQPSAFGFDAPYGSSADIAMINRALSCEARAVQKLANNLSDLVLHASKWTEAQFEDDLSHDYLFSGEDGSQNPREAAVSEESDSESEQSGTPDAVPTDDLRGDNGIEADQYYAMEFGFFPNLKPIALGIDHAPSSASVDASDDEPQNHDRDELGLGLGTAIHHEPSSDDEFHNFDLDANTPVTVLLETHHDTPEDDGVVAQSGPDLHVKDPFIAPSETEASRMPHTQAAPAPTTEATEPVPAAEPRLQEAIGTEAVTSETNAVPDTPEKSSAKARPKRRVRKTHPITKGECVGLSARRVRRLTVT